MLEYRADELVYLKMKGVDPATHEVSAELVGPPSPVMTLADDSGEDKDILRKSQAYRRPRRTYVI